MRTLACIGCVFGGPIYLMSRMDAGADTGELLLIVGLFIAGVIGLYKTWRDLAKG